MSHKVEIFHNVDSVKLQNQINDFISRHQGIEIKEVEYQHVVDNNGDHFFSALIHYIG